MRLIILSLILIISSSTIAQSLDVRLLRQIHTNRNTSLDDAMTVVSNSLYPVSIGVPYAFGIAGLNRKDTTAIRQALTMVGAMAGTSVITLGTKFIIDRERPYQAFPDDFTDVTGNSSLNSANSFPSGHTSIAFTTATSLSLAIPKWYVIVPSYLWASSVAYSRLHLGVHYPSDVLAGALIGVGSAWLSHKLNQKLFRAQKNPR